ncbi:glucosamine-fructose-6-phosphate aminotransferase [Nitzschia inconspicua]|uniref:Glutamine--fructose-6-phosphate aminotransferase [isomerizing] n=1 Tax=Nitzschia inconspicua TaxID=303405 RepID=A0A9K3PX02_9STRA|nr:glucosamine-fructose-6-phosphate aminotransferase [Nitzschia inconspicua]
MISQPLLRTLRRQVASKARTTPMMPVQRRLVVSAVASSSSFSSSSDQTFSPYLVAASALAVAGAAALFQEECNNNHKTDCCGIVGVVATRDHADAREFLLDGLTILKNRGYDSAGIATVSADGGEMSITKFASDGDKADSIELVGKHSHSLGHTLGIAHTRWATHGGKTDENAHPHTDSSGKIALAHNGTLTNANELRRELQKEGHVFTSQTDTEVIAKLIGKYYEEGKDKKITLKEATELALNRCDGTWGLVIICSDNPHELVVACNGSPLVIGIADDRTFIASETSAFNRYTKNFISMKDGEIGVLHADGRTLDLSRKQIAPDQEVKLSPDPFPHWTLKELMEQPEAIARSLNFGGRMSYDRVILSGLDVNEQKMSKIKHMTLSACGTSLNAAKYGERVMKHLGSFDSVHALDAAETSVKDIPCMDKVESTGLIVVSQSGETKDVQRVVVNAMEKGITVLSVVNAVGSLIARTTKLGVYCNAGRENAVASTKAFTTQVTVLTLIALWFKECRDRIAGRPLSVEVGRYKDSLMRLPITIGMALKTCGDQCKKVAERLKDKEHCFVLGKGYAEPVAYEGALKIKEMCYLHAEGYSGGALKHGPFALIEDETGKFGATPIIMFILDDQHAQHMRTAAEEVRARGAELIIITDKPELALDLDDDPIVIPSNGPMTALTGVIPLQLIAYELAMLRGINPDTPRNLAKAVTVD